MEHNHKYRIAYIPFAHQLVFFQLIKYQTNHQLHVIGGLFDTLLIERKLTDAQMECMQFGICDYAPRQVEEVPFFHY